MDMDRRTVLKGASGIVATSALAGCLGGDDGPAGDMTIWYDLGEGEEESLDQWIGTFEDDTDQEIASEAVGELQDRIETAVASGDGPEMWNWAHDWAGDHYDRGFLTDVSDDLNIDVNEMYSDPAVEGIQPPGTDAVVALPGAGETMTLFYNPDLIDEPPETYSEMLSIAEEYHNPANGEYGFTQDVNVYTFSYALQAFGSRVLEVDENDEAILGLEEDGMIQGMELVRDLYQYMPNDLDYDAQISPFVNGNAPLHFNGPWAVGDFNNQDATFEVAELPAVEGGEFTPFNGIDMWYFSDMVSENEDRKATTIEFAEWFTTTEEIVQHYAEEHSYIPVLESIDQDALPDQVATFKTAFDQGVPMPNDSRMNQVWGPLEDAMTEVLTADADIATEFSDAAESIRDSWDE